MAVVQKKVYKSINDVLDMPSALNDIAEDYKGQGFDVSRGDFGMVILKLDDGEVHFVPTGLHIEQILMTI